MKSAIDIISGVASVAFPILIWHWVYRLSQRIDATNKRIDATDAIVDLHWSRTRRR